MNNYQKINRLKTEKFIEDEVESIILQTISELFDEESWENVLKLYINHHAKGKSNSCLTQLKI